MFGLDDMAMIALGQLVVSGVGTVANGIFNGINTHLQKKSANESLRSSYYGYMQQLEGLRGDRAQNQLAMDQTLEDIASNQNYLSRWRDEYDLSMQNGVDEVFGQYQQMASNLGAGLVAQSESGARGGSTALVNAMGAQSLKAANGGSLGGFNLNGRLGSYMRTTAFDMLADRQTAISAVDTGYKALESYRGAMGTLDEAIASMEKTTSQIKKQVKKGGLDV